MSDEYQAVLRPRRQVTLPSEVCDALEVQPGDNLVLTMAEGALIVRPGKQAALEALTALRRAIAESGVTEQEMLESGRQVRDELFRERYPDLARKYGI
ncbi:MAG: AbrB/MazE/SpoVT family DNA-binding domain-containing protein [Dehalococcoidia bacterium]